MQPTTASCSSLRRSGSATRPTDRVQGSSCTQLCQFTGVPDTGEACTKGAEVLGHALARIENPSAEPDSGQSHQSACTFVRVERISANGPALYVYGVRENPAKKPNLAEAEAAGPAHNRWVASARTQ